MDGRPRELEHFLSRPELLSRRGQLLVIFDGTCAFCQRSIRIVRALDWLRLLPAEDFVTASARDPRVARSALDEGIRVQSRDGSMSIGIDAVRAMTLRMPLFAWLGVLLYVPPVRWIGGKAYAWISARRHALGGKASCEI
jgi:predicted DCC family thiol-disulfide oxidoreductase YuxK